MRLLLLSVALLTTNAFAADCLTKKFDTRLVADACADGGQKAAREAMKKFQRAARERDADLDCKSCHQSLSPHYRLKDDALERFRTLGGG